MKAIDLVSTCEKDGGGMVAVESPQLRAMWEEVERKAEAGMEGLHCRGDDDDDDVRPEIDRVQWRLGGGEGGWRSGFSSRNPQKSMYTIGCSHTSWFFMLHFMSIEMT